LRKATYSYAGIVKHKAFTIGIPSKGQIREADYVGIASGRDTDKFAATGFTPVRSELVDAPYAAEVPFVLECRLLHTLEIGLHTQFVGEIADVKAEAWVLGEDGIPDMSYLHFSGHTNYPNGNRRCVHGQSKVRSRL
jgi:flavin reductase (DIM6/NTAB) family NADH-FMN oxidoreductase RutF